MPKIKTKPATPKQKQAMSYTQKIAAYLADPEDTERIRDVFDLLINHIPDTELDPIIEIFKKIQEEIS